MLSAALSLRLFLAQTSLATPNPYLAQAIAQLAALDERAALETLAKAEAWAKDAPMELAKVELYVGLAHAGLNQKPAAEDAFRQALLLDPAVMLPKDCSPVVWSWWREVGGGEGPPTRLPSPSHTWWIPAALTVALGTTAGVCYAEALSRYQALSGSNSLGPLDPGTAQSLKRQGTNFQAVAWVSGGAGVAALGAAIVMGLVRTSPADGAVSLAPTLGRPGVGLAATFR
jgi:hypothetical protein